MPPMFLSDIEAELEAHIKIVERTVTESGSLILNLANSITKCLQGGNKLLLCGNGGSAADAQHIAAEFVNRFGYDRGALPAIALTTDTSILTAIGNDSSFEYVFSRQVEALGKRGDILAGISTSGRSPNVLKALDAAQKRGIGAVGFTGAGGLEIMGPKCDFCLAVPSTATARIQECHGFVWHVICGMVERALFPA
jgi:D-sedoheptulose 7-phosphate isomerase